MILICKLRSSQCIFTSSKTSNRTIKTNNDMKLQLFINGLKPLLQESFNTSETIQWLTRNRQIFWSWGVSKKFNVESKGLLMRVNGNHFNGYVLITLSPMDTYTVHLIKTNGKVVETIEDVYCDQLQEIIDNKIERIPEYVN